MIPTWLQRRISDTHRTVRLRLCRTCRAPIITGLDADNCAFTVRADPTPTDEIGEAIALLTGRRTFDLVGIGGQKQLYIREDHNIKSTRRYPVLPEHRCGESLAAHIQPAAAPARHAIPEVPQF